MAQKIGSVCGLIYAVREDRVVLINPRGSAYHVFIGDDITPEQRADLEKRMGGPAQLWAKKDSAGRMVLLPKKGFVPISVPRSTRFAI